MRPPWLGHSREEVELEALQTDIMRFMAILGLCLAAIFSLVQGAAQEQAAAEQSAAAHGTMRPATIEQVVVEATALEQTAVAQAKVKQAIEPAPSAPKPSPPIAQSAPVIGFTLEFASVQALEMLLQSGTVQLFARHGDQFWSVGTNGIAVPAQTPSSYYQMHTETVPQRLRSSVPGSGIGEEIAWGVTLPREAVGQIQRLTTGRKSGNLLIGYDGAVVLESASGNISAQNSRSHRLLPSPAEVYQRE